MNYIEFPFVSKAFKEEPVIQELLKSYPLDYIKKGLHCSIIDNNEKKVTLQFCGWEIVLLSDGTYFINDTSGG